MEIEGSDLTQVGWCFRLQLRVLHLTFGINLNSSLLLRFLQTLYKRLCVFIALGHSVDHARLLVLEFPLLDLLEAFKLHHDCLRLRWDPRITTQRRLLWGLGAQNFDDLVPTQAFVAAGLG